MVCISNSVKKYFDVLFLFLIFFFPSAVIPVMQVICILLIPVDDDEYDESDTDGTLGFTGVQANGWCTYYLGLVQKHIELKTIK